MTGFLSLLLQPSIPVIASGVLVIAVFLLVFTRQRHRSTVLRLPTTLPLLGDLMEVAKNYHRSLDWLSDACANFNGEPWRLRIAGQADHIILSTPEAFEEVLIKQFEDFPHGEHINSRVRQLFGDSILTTDGDRWFHQRKAASKFFNSRTLRECMLTTMKKNVSQLQDQLDLSVAGNQPIDMTKLLFQFTVQTFTETALGIRLDWIGAEKSIPFEEFLTTGSTAVIWRFLSPDCVWRLQRWLGVGHERKFLAITKTTRMLLQSLVQQSLDAAIKRKQQQQQSQASDDDSVKNMVELFLEQSSEDKDGLNENDLVDFLLAFVLAAQVSSALSMTWLFWTLTKHSEIELRIRDEMEAVLPSMGVDRTTYLTTEHVHRLVYLEATVRETLRLYPSIPNNRREVVSDTDICGTTPLRKGEMVLLSMYAMARNTSVWGEDAAEFNPSRWISSTGELKSFPSTMFSTFGAGPRGCVGMKLAILELRVTVANLLHRNRFSLAVPNDGRHAMRVALMMQEPLATHVEQVSM